VSVRKDPLEAATLSILQQNLVTEHHARLFAEEFGREMAQIAARASQQDQATTDRQTIVTREIGNLAANVLTGVLSPTLVKLLSEREVEKARLEANFAE
jgi:hypothetical protein